MRPRTSSTGGARSNAKVVSSLSRRPFTTSHSRLARLVRRQAGRGQAHVPSLPGGSPALKACPGRQDAKGPAANTWRAGPLLRIDPAASYSPTRRPCSTIGAGGLNGRVRDGNGCFPSAITAGNRITNWTGRSLVESKRVVAHSRQNYGQAARPFSTG